MSAPRSRRSYTQDFKDELCREVINTSKPIVDVARSYGVGPESLRRWLIKYRETHNSPDAAATGTELSRLKELEKENQELRAENLFLKKPAWIQIVKATPKSSTSNGVRKPKVFHGRMLNS